MIWKQVVINLVAFLLIQLSTSMNTISYFQRSIARVSLKPAVTKINHPNRQFFTSLGQEKPTSGEHEKTYLLYGVGNRSKVEITTNTGHKLSTDVPKKMGGTDTAPQPVETLLAAWMGCTQATAVFVGRQMAPRVVIDSIEFVDIQASRDERGALTLPIEETPTIPSRLQRISGQIQVAVKGSTQLSNEQLELLRDQTESRCPVANMIIASGCEMHVEWIPKTSPKK